MESPISRRKASRMSAGILASAVAMSILVAGCSTTVEETPQAANAIAAGGPLPAAVTGFMGADTSNLAPGPQGGAALIYINPNAQWIRYSKIQLLPVEFWADANSTVPKSDQQTLATYMFNALKTDLEKDFTIVNQAGSDTLTLRVALMDASAATPGLRSISVIVPQIKIINMAQSMVTGSYAFVGSAEAEMKATDSVTGQTLAAAVDKRAGGAGFKGAASFQWGDAENAIDYWAQRFTKRLLELQGKPAVS